jgi:formamidopyrimidine-DNA glycosylase
VPELPDITAYIDALESRVLGDRLNQVRVAGLFLLRTVDPPVTAVNGRKIVELRRVGKRIAFGLEDDLWLVLHLMIAGRLHWKPPDFPLKGRQSLAAFDFPNGSLTLTEAGTRRRASLHVLRGEEALQNLDPGGIDVMKATPGAFREALSKENHTLKRALTDPHFVSGIGNAYSDEILHEAQLSPLAQTQKLKDEEWARLHSATQTTLQTWIDRFRAEAGRNFPEKVTAFRKEMAVHGRHGLPCPRCGSPVQRIRYADNETNYCPVCQTSGRLLADRGLSRLLGADWPRTLEELEELKAR